MQIKTRCIRSNVWLLLIILFTEGHSQNFEDARSYITYKTQSTIEIDGMATEVSWKQAPWTEYFIDIEGIKKQSSKHLLHKKLML